MDNLRTFRTTVIAGVLLDHNGSPLGADDWSGFACIVKEGLGVLYSASLKRGLSGDPRDVKPIYQKQNLTGFALLNVEAITALFGDQPILRTQLVYRRLSADELQKQIDALLALKLTVE